MLKGWMFVLNVIDKLYLLLYFGCADDTLLGILGTYFKHNVITNFDTIYVNKTFNKTNIEMVFK